VNISVPYEIKEERGFKYIEEGSGETFILLHGLFGALSNWSSVVDQFSSGYKIVIPLLPIYEMPIRKAGLEGLVNYIEQFIEIKGYERFNLMGNSLGGHIALIFTLNNQDKVNRLILTGSSGLFESAMGGSFPKRGSYEYIKERVEYTFYDPKVATEEYVKEIFDTTNDIQKCLRIISIAKSAQRQNLAMELPNLSTKTLLIWGLNDTITPPEVAYEFNRLIRHSTLRFIDKCCHAPMMERPEEYNNILSEYLSKN
jgi:pimeloyl-ACP methyl ester carboxylesterase